MDNLQLSQVHKTDKVTFIRQVPWCAVVQSPSLSLQGQELRKSLFTSDIFRTLLGLLPWWSQWPCPNCWLKTLDFHPISPMNTCLLSLSALFSPWPTGQDLGQLTASWLPSIKSCKEHAQAVHPQRTLGWQLTLSLGLVDTEFPMVKAPTEAKTFLLSSLLFPLWPYPFWCEKFNREDCMMFKLRPNK